MEFKLIFVFEIWLINETRTERRKHLANFKEKRKHLSEFQKFTKRNLWWVKINLLICMDPWSCLKFKHIWLERLYRNPGDRSELEDKPTAISWSEILEDMMNIHGEKSEDCRSGRVSSDLTRHAHKNDVEPLSKKSRHVALERSDTSVVHHLPEPRTIISAIQVNPLSTFNPPSAPTTKFLRSFRRTRSSKFLSNSDVVQPIPFKPVLELSSSNTKNHLAKSHTNDRPPLNTPVQKNQHRPPLSTNIMCSSTPPSHSTDSRLDFLQRSRFFSISCLIWG